MQRFLSFLFAAGAAVVLMLSPAAAGTVIFSDDFEQADPIGTYMPDSPPVGEDWTDYYPGSTQHWIEMNPASDAVNPSSLAFYMERGMSQSSAIIQIQIAEADQTLIAANGNLTFETKFYNVEMEDSQGLYVIGLESESGTLSPRGFNPVYWGDGTVEAQLYVDDAWIRVDTGLRYTNDAWHTTKVVADLATDTYDLWVDGETTVDAQDIPFCHQDHDFTTIKRITIGTAYKPSAFFIDDMVVSVEAGQAPIPGDANGDRQVTDADAAILATNWQQCDVGWAQGDFNADGCVTDADAAILATHWQEGAEGQTAAVPEPTTVVLLLSAFGLLLLVRRAF